MKVSAVRTLAYGSCEFDSASVRSSKSLAHSRRDDEDDGTTSEESAGRKPLRGYSVAIATLFIVGENGGCVVLTLPYALVAASWIGIGMLILCAINAAVAALALSHCWMMLEERWPAEYGARHREPYGAIGFRAYGKWMKYAVGICTQVALVGTGVVMLLVCADLINSLIGHAAGICFCSWILILGVVLAPLMWFATPYDFWPASIFAVTTTTLAIVLIVWVVFEDAFSEGGSHPQTRAEYPAPTVKGIFLTFGTILFAYGSTAAFPSYQNDMKDKGKFPYAILFAFLIMQLFYVPIPTLGYAIYGDKLEENITLSIPDGLKRKLGQSFMAIHLLFAFLLTVNAPSQEIESLLNLPKKFTWKRIASRSLLMLLMVFLATSVPQFSKLLNLIGGSMIACIAFIFPPLFYMKLARDEEGDVTKPRRISTAMRIFLWQIVVLGAAGGMVCTYAAVEEIVNPAAFTKPCWMDFSYQCT